ncbi:unnamed protein product [Cochlearia groenlandica]
MGIDPKTHEPLPSQAPASPTTRHMAQWESARLEAEARLSRESMLFTPPPSSYVGRHDCDHFLRIWNSEIGESFRNLAPFEESTTTKSCCVGKEVVVGIHGCDSSSTPCSNNLEDDSSGSALQLLLDFQISDDDMSFLEENISSYSESTLDVVSMISSTASVLSRVSPSNPF